MLNLRGTKNLNVHESSSHQRSNSFSDASDVVLQVRYPIKFPPDLLDNDSALYKEFTESILNQVSRVDRDFSISFLR